MQIYFIFGFVNNDKAFLTRTIEETCVRYGGKHSTAHFAPHIFKTLRRTIEIP